MRSIIALVLSLVVVGFGNAQSTYITGKVTDAESGDPVPFANIYFKGTTIGTTTDFEGWYRLESENPTDSLTASYVGYKSRSKAVTAGVSQEINFQLVPDMQRLNEVVFLAGENPAFEIIRRVVANKPVNDKRSLSAYEHESYSKIEIDIDNISDKFRNKPIMQQITRVLDSIQVIVGEDGKPVLPVFISESVSQYYVRRNPDLDFEKILKTRISGVGLEDGSLVAQLIGSSFQQYNFYANWLNIVSKDFVSPVADGWRLYYDYDLIDSVDVGGYFCYRIDFFPRSEQDLAFTGTMWITKNEYAIKQIDAFVGPEANLNFIEKIRIQQELEKLPSGVWLPAKNRVLIDVGEIQDQWAGLLARFYTSNKNFVENQPKEPRFYERGIALEPDYLLNEDEDYWNTVRHDPLTETEKNVYRMIDTLRNIPVVRSYIDLMKLVVSGYKEVGKVDIGPYLAMFALNDVEGLRLQSGFKTNLRFSNRWILGAQLGYGFKDERFKYSAFVTRILDRTRWTTIDFRYRSDVGRVGINEENLDNSYLFLTASKFGFFRRAYYFDEARVTANRELFKGFSQQASFRYSTFNPLFSFAFLTEPGDLNSIRQGSFEIAELMVESRFARDEVFVQNDNDRISLGALRSPIVTLRYTHGMKGIGGSDFEYDKLRLTVEKRMNMGILGTGYATVRGEYIFNTLPYPLLNFHLGNQSVFFTEATNNLMNYGEFVSDHYAELKYQQHFEGFVLNRIPLMRKLKWRLVGTANVIYGGLREANKTTISDTTPSGEETLPVGYFGNQPYVELGYGVENILRFLRVDFVHRMTYLNNPDVRKFGVLLSIQFDL